MADARPVLKRGDTGEDVVELQRALDVPWLLDDGVFGFATECVVGAYRVSKGLPMTGAVPAVVDQPMWDMLGVDEYLET